MNEYTARDTRQWSVWERLYKELTVERDQPLKSYPQGTLSMLRGTNGAWGFAFVDSKSVRVGWSDYFLGSWLILQKFFSAENAGLKSSGSFVKCAALREFSPPPFL